MLHKEFINRAILILRNRICEPLINIKIQQTAVDIWSNHLKSFGLGQFMGYDLPTGRKGNIPTSKTYKKMYPNGGWRVKQLFLMQLGKEKF